MRPVLFLMALVSAALGAWIMRSVRGRLRSKNPGPWCARCGYDRAGTPRTGPDLEWADEPCRECGRGRLTGTDPALHRMYLFWTVGLGLLVLGLWGGLSVLSNGAR